MKDSHTSNHISYEETYSTAQRERYTFFLLLLYLFLLQSRSLFKFSAGQSRVARYLLPNSHHVEKAQTGKVNQSHLPKHRTSFFLSMKCFLFSIHLCFQNLYISADSYRICLENRRTHLGTEMNNKTLHIRLQPQRIPYRMHSTSITPFLYIW